MEIKDVVLDIMSINNLIDKEYLGGFDAPQVEIIKSLTSEVNIGDFIKKIGSVSKLYNLAGDIVINTKKVKHKEYLILTNTWSESLIYTEEFKRAIKYIDTDGDKLADITQYPSPYEVTITTFSKLPYTITIVDNLNNLRGMKFDKIYANISLPIQTIVKVEELFPNTKLTYYGIEEFMYRKTRGFETNN